MDHYSVTCKTSPTDEPVTLAEAKAHLRIDGDDDDDLLTAEITAARQHLEKWMTFCSTTWQMWLDRFPGQDLVFGAVGEIVLTRPPVQSVSSVKYVDNNGVLQTLAGTEYQVSQGRNPPRIWPAYAKSWPATRFQPEAVVVEYEAGWGDTEDVPPLAKQAVLILVAHLYAFREPVITGTIVNTIPLSVFALMKRLDHGWRG